MVKDSLRDRVDKELDGFSKVADIMEEWVKSIAMDYNITEKQFDKEWDRFMDRLGDRIMDNMSGGRG